MSAPTTTIGEFVESTTAYKTDGPFTFSTSTTGVYEQVSAAYWNPETQFYWSKSDSARFLEDLDRKETLDEVKARMEAWAAQALPCMVAGSRLDLHQRVMRYHAAGLGGLVLRPEIAAEVPDGRLPFTGWHLKLTEADLLEGLTWDHIDAIESLSHICAALHDRAAKTYKTLLTAPAEIVERLFATCSFREVHSMESLRKIVDDCEANHRWCRMAS